MQELLRRLVWWAVPVLALAAVTSEVQAQCITETLAAHDPTLSANFGWEIELDGHRLAVGVRNLPTAYVFERIGDTWVEVQKLESPKGSIYWGQEVALDGDTLVLSDRFSGSNGEVYIFEHDGEEFVHAQTLSGLTASPFTEAFGSDLALDGDRLLVSDRNAHDEGRAFVYERSEGTWAFTAELSTAGKIAFGQWIALDGDVAAIGSYAGPDNRVHVFEHDGSSWSEVAELDATMGGGGAANDNNFGQGLSVNGDRIAVGTPDEQSDQLGNAATFVFERTAKGWAWAASLPSPHAPAGLAFGCSVDLDGDRLLVGSYLGSSIYGPLTGTVTLYEHAGDGWDQVAQFGPADTPGNSQFGWSVALDGDSAAASSLLGLVDGIGLAGSVSVMNVTGFVVEQGLGFDLPPAIGSPLRLQATQLTCQGAWGQFELSGASPVGGQLLALVIGLETLHAPLLGGTLVPTPDLVLFSVTPPAFTGTYVWQGMIPEGLPPELNLYLQAWMTNTLGPEGWVASNGLHVVVP